MKVYFAADHAGFKLKSELLNYVRGDMGYEVEDCGALTLEPSDDYPDIVARAAQKLAKDAAAGIDNRAIVIGASGQGEAMAANRFKGVRCALYYGTASKNQTDIVGNELDIVASTREHNNANALSLGARFISADEARAVVKSWLKTCFSDDARHVRRTARLDEIS
ncbi:MAG: RpiB/LacA/LacB family sugar-phosphate isomerase [Patescibacteria group bacterium]